MKSPKTIVFVAFILNFYLPYNSVDGTLIKFYQDDHFQGLFFEKSAEYADGCINFPAGNDHASSVMTNGACIYIYEHGNCEGLSRKLPGGSEGHSILKNYNFDDVTSSFRVCSPEQAAEKSPMYTLYDDDFHSDQMVEYRDICECTNLPSYAEDRVTSVMTYGNCIRLYENKNCGGRMIELGPNSTNHHNVGLDGLNFNDITSSINVCSLPKTCQELNAVIKKIIFPPGSVRDVLRSTKPKRIELATTSTFLNNATSEIREVYKKKNTYRETFEFEEVESLSQMHSVGVEVTVSVQGGASVPFVADGKVKTAIKTAYQFQSTSKSESRKKHTSENIREFEVSKEYTVPPCTKYEVSAFMEVVENVPIKYDILSTVTGKRSGQQIAAQQLKGLLPDGMTFVSEDGPFAVIGKTEGQIVASLGIKSDAEAHSAKIENCNV